jgi:copper(I)-binding protein
MRPWRSTLALIIMMVSAGALGQTSNNRNIGIEKAWARISPSEPGTVSIFFDITNTADEADTLRFATSPIAGKVLLRKGRWDGYNFHNDQAKGVPVKAGRMTSFHPGVLEITLKELNAPAIVGETITVRLNFAHAGEVTITPTVSNQLLGNRTRK